jgi:predicted permease
MKPDWQRLVRDGLPPLDLPPEREAEVVEELAQLLADTAMATGVAVDDPDAVDTFVRQQVPAWSALVQALGTPIASQKHLPQEKHTMSFLTGLRNDLRQGWRQLARRPGFTVVAVLATGLGIGLTTAIFSLVDYALFRPFPVERPGELVNVYSAEPGGFLPEEPMAYPDIVDIGEASETLESLAANSMVLVAVEHGEEARLEIGNLVTGNYFETLGVRPAAGRLLTPADDQRGDPQPVVVLDHATWQALYGGAREAIGTTLRINGHPLTVVGVLPEAFHGLMPAIQPRVWLPMSLRPVLGTLGVTNAGSVGGEPLDNRGQRWLWAVGRRAAGASLEQVREELATLATGLQQAHPESNEERAFVALPTQGVRILPAVDSGIRAGSAVVLVLVGLVLLIACANVGNMLLARALGRRSEMATRLSLGAGRRHILRQLLVEGLLLATLGAVLGLAFAAIFHRLLGRVEMPALVPVSLDLRLDWRVLLFTAGLAGLSALLFALAPALEMLRTNLSASLHGGARGGRGRGQRLQSGLVLAQVGLSLVLLVCAGLTVRSLLNAHTIDPGFDPEGVVIATLDPHLQGYEEPEWRNFYQQLREDLAARPEVTSVAYAGHLPLSFAVNTAEVAPSGEEGAVEDRPEVDAVSVSAGYFETLGVEMVRGRAFQESDRQGSPWVAVVNETLAESFWPGKDPLGQRLVEGERSYEVVGVARDGKYRSLGEAPRPFFYRSLDQVAGGSFRTLTVRFRSAEAASAAAVRGAIRRHGPHLAVSNLSSLEEALSSALLLPRLAGRLFTFLGFLGLFLAATGLYGVLAHAVARRTHEIGVRMAMGARRRDVLALVFRKGLGLTAIGAVLGLGLATLVTRMLQGILYGVSATDLGIFAAVAATLFAVAALACYLPARRASSVDPLTALRHE